MCIEHSLLNDAAEHLSHTAENRLVDAIIRIRNVVHSVVTMTANIYSRTSFFILPLPPPSRPTAHSADRGIAISIAPRHKSETHPRKRRQMAPHPHPLAPVDRVRAPLHAGRGHCGGVRVLPEADRREALE